MKSLWDDHDATAIVRRYAEEGAGEDLALRVYTTRLLGGDPRLVLHGGGNTSVKTAATDLLGDRYDVLCVKGSGWDMATIEPAGLPAVKLAALLKARRLDRLSDENMVALQRSNLIDPGATRTKMRAAAFPGENPETRPLPEEITEAFVRLAGADFNESGIVVQAQEA